MDFEVVGGNRDIAIDTTEIVVERRHNGLVLDGNALGVNVVVGRVDDLAGVEVEIGGLHAFGRLKVRNVGVERTYNVNALESRLSCHFRSLDDCSSAVGRDGVGFVWTRNTMEVHNKDRARIDGLGSIDDCDSRAIYQDLRFLRNDNDTVLEHVLRAHGVIAGLGDFLKAGC